MSKFNEYFINTVKHRYSDFKGRATRSEYWYFILFYVIIAIILLIIDIALINPMIGLTGDAASQGSVLTFIFTFGMLPAQIGLVVRRLHDIGKTGWWYFLIFIPIIGALVLLYFFVQDSQPGTNMYGPNPKGL